ncbi:MAG TPA: glutamyl-tRNA reductase [Puia sp.]|nr:glutamyl-tRNA reductase [Puia sp.]
MSKNPPSELSHFFVAGINYKKTDTGIRGSFAISPEQYNLLLNHAVEYGVRDLFVLSTCNRSEIYGIAESPNDLINLFCAHTQGSPELFHELAYQKNGLQAVQHLFNVGAGLDSQILGDYEIVGQLRQAMKFAKERGFINNFMERLLNQVLQSSKEIKNTTALSDGTVSVAFAAIQYIRENISPVEDKRILLLGTGKIGTITCKNLVDYLGNTHITLINRTPEKAEHLAEAFNLRTVSIEQLPEEIRNSDIILVATNAPEPIIRYADLENISGDKLIIDLSIPCNVENRVKDLHQVKLIDVDDLSLLKDETLLRRAAEVPKARAIIQNHFNELMDWYEMRKHVPVLKQVKIKLQEIHGSPLFEQLVPGKPSSIGRDQKIQRVLNGMASKMRRENQRGCYYIEAINEFIAC